MSQIFDKNRRSERQKFYHTKTWRIIRSCVLRRNPLCENCRKSKPPRLTVATVCDHISPHWSDWKRFKQGPFQALCRECHSEKTAFYDIPSMIKREKTKTEVKDV